jgi:hypothetical protein
VEKESKNEKEGGGGGARKIKINTNQSKNPHNLFFNRLVLYYHPRYRKKK